MSIYRLGNRAPSIAADAFIAPGAQIIGDVTIGAGSSIWFNCVLRGDAPGIRIGARTNIQDGTIIHITTPNSGTTIGDDVLVGHQAIIHACTLEDNAFVGMGAIVLDDAVIEGDAMLGAGSLLGPGKRIPRGQLWLGRPAKYVRDLTEQDIAYNRLGVQHYTHLAQYYRQELAPL